MRLCGNIGRDGESTVTCTLEELQSKSVNMFTTVLSEIPEPEFRMEN